MASQEVYYVPDGSKWPIIATLALFTSFLGGAVWFNGGDIGALNEFQLYLDNVYDCDIDNLGMTIELVWVYEND